jgi:hypothetical protein
MLGWPHSGFGAHVGAGDRGAGRNCCGGSSKVEVEVRPRCRGPMRIVGLVTAWASVRQILAHLERSGRGTNGERQLLVTVWVPPVTFQRT